MTSPSASNSLPRPPDGDPRSQHRPSSSTSIALVAINARYSHCGHAIRSLLANLDVDLADGARMLEFDLDTQPLQIAAGILSLAPRIVGFSLYLWNTELARQAIEILRLTAPGLQIVLGGPEIIPGHAARWRGLADYLIQGEGEVTFNDLCRKLLGAAPDADPRTTVNWIPEKLPDLSVIKPPYGLYSEDDLRRRVVYVEASRGCPHHCLYCTSCGSGMRLYPLESIKQSFRNLLRRGLRNFRFLDRTFNADEGHAVAILDFFLESNRNDLTLHLELSPVDFGPALRESLRSFPPGQLHLEIGVQTLNPVVARAIGRHEDREEVLRSLDFLSAQTQADLHVDLIFGLPKEDLASFAAGFNRLVAFQPGAIQVNRLKVLPGTPLSRLPSVRNAHSPTPPYDLLFSDTLDFGDMMRLQRFAHAWDRLYNRGRFQTVVPLLLSLPGPSPFEVVDELAARAYAQHGRVHALGLRDWSDQLREYIRNHHEHDQRLLDALVRDSPSSGR